MLVAARAGGYADILPRVAGHCKGIRCQMSGLSIESIAVTVVDASIRDNRARLDPIDKGIIEQLQEDGRRSYAAIARAVGLSEAATRQRVQRLIDDGVIQIAAVTDASAIGFHRMALLGVKVDGDIRQVAEKLASLEEAEYVVICAGQFDLLVELICEDDDHLLRILDERVRTVPGVRNTETFVYLKVVKETYQWGTR